MTSASPSWSKSRLRPDVADPQGATIERALPALGFGEVAGVRVGKAIRFTVEAADEAAARAQVEELCRALPHQPGDRGRRHHDRRPVGMKVGP